MRVQITTSRELSELDRASLEKAIQRLDRQTATYRMCHLQVSVDGVGHSNDRDVKMVLALPRHRLLVVEERAEFLGPAALRCVEALARKIELAKPRGRRAHERLALRSGKWRMVPVGA